jgi:hypothetical protein
MSDATKATDMAVFVLTAEDQDRLRQAKTRALADPVALEVVERLDGAAVKDAAGVVRGERPKGVQEPQEVILPLGWRVALSCEQQPLGLVLHLSISSPTPQRTLPRPEAVDMVAEALGVGKPIHVWIEAFKYSGVEVGKAVNVLFALAAEKSH